MLSRSRSLAAALFGVLLASSVVLAMPTAAQAGDGSDRPGVSAGAVNSTQGEVTAAQPVTQVHSGSSGSHGSGDGGGSGSTGGSGTSGLPGVATGSGTNSCDPASYPNGWSSGLAVPSPCAPLPQCGAYVGSIFVPQACPAGPATPQAPAAPVITTQMVTEAARVTAPSTPPNVEPGNLSFVNIPNNYWAATPTVNGSVTVLGLTIPLRWTPTGTTWNFGDGASATGNGIQGADVGAAGAVEHAYARQGSYAITTTTTYDLTFTLPGGGTQTIQLASPPSPPVTLPVREIQTLTSWVS